MNATRSLSVLAFAGAGFLSGCTPPESATPKAPPPKAPATAEGDPESLGLRPPTAEEKARLEEISKKNPELTPNELARARLNEERKAQGLAPLPAEPATPPPAPAPK